MSNYHVVRINLGRGSAVLSHLERLEFREKTYREQLAILIEKGLIFAGCFSAEMAHLGNIATDLVIDIEPLQKQWANENGLVVDFSTPDWMKLVLLEQLKTLKPDVIYIQGGAFQRVNNEVRQLIKESVPNVRYITGFWGDQLTGIAHYRNAFSGVNCVFSASHGYKRMISEGGIRSELLGWGFDPRAASYSPFDDSENYKHLLTFSGATGYGCDLHRGRYEDLVSLMRMSDLRIWTDEVKIDKKPAVVEGESFLRAWFSPSFWIKGGLSVVPIRTVRAFRNSRLVDWKLAKVIDKELHKRAGQAPIGQYFVNKQPISELFPEKCMPGLYGESYYDLIRSSEFVINRHRDEQADGPNIRVFEVTGLSSCLVTDRGREIADFFEPDKEFLSFSSPKEALKKIEYFAKHPDERKEIAAAGAARVQKEHTIARKCEQIDQVIQRSI